jgi:hypothetical protein
MVVRTLLLSPFFHDMNPEMRLKWKELVMNIEKRLRTVATAT